MAIKKDMKTWAIKLRGRSFFLSSIGAPWTFSTRKEAEQFAQSVTDRYGTNAEPVRVRVRVEEV